MSDNAQEALPIACALLTFDDRQFFFRKKLKQTSVCVGTGERGVGLAPLERLSSGQPPPSSAEEAPDPRGQGGAQAEGVPPEKNNLG